MLVIFLACAQIDGCSGLSQLERYMQEASHHSFHRVAGQVRNWASASPVRTSVLFQVIACQAACGCSENKALSTNSHFDLLQVPSFVTR